MRRPRAGVLVLAAAVVGVGVAVLVSAGWRGLLVYSFFAGVAALFAFGAGLGGRVVTDVSRGRFERGDRR